MGKNGPKVTMRALRKEDRADYGKVMASAYYQHPRDVELWLRGVPYGNTLGLFAGPELVSALSFARFSSAFGGKWVAMGGVGGVGTRTDRQGRGYAGMLLNASLGAMRNAGFPVSILFPFSFRYYRKFGWELGATGYDFDALTPADFVPFPEYSLVEAASAADFAAMTRCYNEFAALHNGMVQRTATTMRGKLASWAEARGQLYVVRDGSAVTGWFVQRPQHEGHSANVRIPEMIFLTSGARRALMGFLSRSPALVKSISFSCPHMPGILEEFSEPRVSMRLTPLYQIRLVDVEKALAARGYAGPAGEVVIEVTDDCAEWNCGTWALAVRDGTPKVRRSTRSPDISFDQRQLAQLYSGHLPPDELSRRDGVTVHRPVAVETLRGWFDPRPPYILDYF